MLQERPLRLRRSSTRVWVGPIFSIQYIPHLECPEAELCDWVWEEKCNGLHLNGSTLANTLGLSFTGVRTPPEFTERGLQGSGTNEAAGISLARYKLLFSCLEAAASTSYYFTEWKGFTINDAIMLMVLPSCVFASPRLVSINPNEEWGEWKCRGAHSENLSFQKQTNRRILCYFDEVTSCVFEEFSVVDRLMELISLVSQKHSVTLLAPLNSPQWHTWTARSRKDLWQSCWDMSSCWNHRDK